MLPLSTTQNNEREKIMGVEKIMNLFFIFVQLQVPLRDPCQNAKYKTHERSLGWR